MLYNANFLNINLLLSVTKAFLKCLYITDIISFLVGWGVGPQRWISNEGGGSDWLKQISLRCACAVPKLGRMVSLV